MQSSPNWTVSTVLHTTTINFSPSDQYSLPELIDSDILGPDDIFECSIFQNNVVDVGVWISVKYKKWWFSLEPPRKTAETIFQHSLLCWESSSEGTIQLTPKLKQVRHEKFRLLQYKLCESTYTFLSTVKCREWVLQYPTVQIDFKVLESRVQWSEKLQHRTLTGIAGTMKKCSECSNPFTLCNP